MAGSTTEEIPCQATEDAKKMAILLTSPLRRGAPEGRQRQTGAETAAKLARVTQPPPSPRGRPALPFYRGTPTKTGASAHLWITGPAVDN
jgi:hypothetical protein